MRERRYAIYDVFTDRPLAGNPLAVVFDADDLDAAAMQAIAREFNLSETAFLREPENALHAAALVIYTPAHELPFAGHPTVGSAIAFAESRSRESGAAMDIVVLEERVGDVRCVVSRGNGASFAEFDLPLLPAKLEEQPDADDVAAALGLGPHEIGFENHEVAAWSAGVPYVCVPVAGLDVAARARIDAARWRDLAPSVDGVLADPFIYCRDTVNHDCAFHARMFAPDSGIEEDPATGSAVAALTGAIVRHDAPPSGAHRYWIEQGIEMGRPSRMRLEVEVEGGAIRSARIGGHAVRVASGTLFL